MRVAEFARHTGWSVEGVYEAVRAGRLAGFTTMVKGPCPWRDIVEISDVEGATAALNRKAEVDRGGAMSLAEFARHVGVHPGTVDHAVRVGRLEGFVTLGKVKRPGAQPAREILDVEGATAAWRGKVDRAGAMTLAEFARHVGVCANSVRHAVAAGRLEGFVTRVKRPRLAPAWEIADVEGATAAWSKKAVTGPFRHRSTDEIAKVEKDSEAVQPEAERRPKERPAKKTVAVEGEAPATRRKVAEPGAMTARVFAMEIGVSAGTVIKAIEDGRLEGFGSRVGSRWVITDAEGATAAWRRWEAEKAARREKEKQDKILRWSRAELGPGDRILNLLRPSSSPALAFRWWIEGETYPSFQRPCRRCDCEPSGTCPWCGASPVAMRIQIPAGEVEDAPARLLCPRCAREVRWRGTGEAGRWEKQIGEGEPAGDPRDLPAAVLNRCRPCPFAGCRHHLCLNLESPTSLTFATPAVPIWEMPESCSLDVAAQTGGVELADLPALVGRSYDRSFQIVDEALLRAREVLDGTGEDRCPWGWKGNRDKPSTLAAIPIRSTTKDEWRGRMSGAPMPDLPLLPFRRPDREEVARLFPGAAVSPEYGKRRPTAKGEEREAEIEPRAAALIDRWPGQAVDHSGPASMLIRTRLT